MGFQSLSYSFQFPSNLQNSKNMHLSSLVPSTIASYAAAGAVADGTLLSPSQTVSGLKGSTPTALMAVSQDGKTEYAFFPVNGTNEAALAKTESNIQRITQLPRVFSFREKSNNNTLSFWLVGVTDMQLQEIRQDEGIDGAEQKYISEKAFASLPLPTDAPHPK